MIEINDLGLAHHYLDRAASERAAAEDETAPTARTIRLQLAKLYEERAAAYSKQGTVSGGFLSKS